MMSIYAALLLTEHPLPHGGAYVYRQGSLWCCIRTSGVARYGGAGQGPPARAAPDPGQQ